jgi:hypothetical protein
MKNLKGKFNVGEVNGQKVGKDFEYEYKQFDTFEEMASAWGQKEILEQINSYEKASAKANEYQKVTAPYRPDPNDPAVKREQSIQNMVKIFNVPRAVAEQQINAMIAAAKTEETPAVTA